MANYRLPLVLRGIYDLVKHQQRKDVTVRQFNKKMVVVKYQCKTGDFQAIQYMYDFCPVELVGEFVANNVTTGVQFRTTNVTDFKKLFDKLNERNFLFPYD